MHKSLALVPRFSVVSAIKKRDSNCKPLIFKDQKGDRMPPSCIVSRPLDSPIASARMTKLQQSRPKYMMTERTIPTPQHDSQLRSTPEHHKRECNNPRDGPKTHFLGALRLVRHLRSGIAFNNAGLLLFVVRLPVISNLCSEVNLHRFPSAKRRHVRLSIRLRASR